MPILKSDLVQSILPKISSRASTSIPRKCECSRPKRGPLKNKAEMVAVMVRIRYNVRIQGTHRPHIIQFKIKTILYTII